jgi:hypothetical protein
MVTIIPNSNYRLHIRFEGRSWDIAQVELDLGQLSSDEGVRAAVAAYLQVPANKLAYYVIERHANGNMTVRPEAIFG